LRTGRNVSGLDATEIVLGPSGLADRRTRGRRPSILIMVCFLFLALITVCAVFGTDIAPYKASVEDLGNSFAGVSGSHIFGTDALGRDIFSRPIVGAKLALIGPLLIALGSMLIGNFLGTLSGYHGGLVDFAIMRWADLMFSLPALLVAIVVVGVLGGG